MNSAGWQQGGKHPGKGHGGGGPGSWPKPRLATKEEAEVCAAQVISRMDPCPAC